MNLYQPLKIGKLTAERPVIQGGMGIGISLSNLAGAVAKAGGVGIISAAQIGFREKKKKKNPLEANMRAMESEFKKAKAISEGNGIVGFNIMVAMKKYENYVRAAVKAGADLIISGAGLPVKLPEYAACPEKESPEGATLFERIAARKTMLAPVVSSVKAARVICRLWDRNYKTAPDLLVVEGPLAGGHLGFSREELAEYGAEGSDTAHTYQAEKYGEEIKGILKVAQEFGEKYGKKIPVVSAGGVFGREDMAAQMALGVDGIQVATRFVTTKECDAADEYKKAYLNAKAEDVEIVNSPVGMPGRAIRNDFLMRIKQMPEKITACFQCLEHCNPATIPYCITKALIHAAVGDVKNGLLFCGSNVYRCTKMETVEEIMKDLCEA